VSPQKRGVRLRFAPTVLSRGVCEIESTLHSDRPDILQDLLGLEWQDAEEDYVAFSYYSLVVVIDPDTKLLLESPKEMWLPRRNIKLHVGDLT
jgi:hypothetical protein